MEEREQEVFSRPLINEERWKELDLQNRERETEVFQLTPVVKTRNNSPIPISVMNKTESKGFKF